MSDALIGWGAMVEFHNGTSLIELQEVVSFPLPDDEADDVEVTHLKSAGKRREYISGLIDGGTVDVELNYVPGSATDALIRAQKALGLVRTIVFTIPDGDTGWEITTSAFIKGYARGPIEAGGKLNSVVRFRITGAQTEAAAA